MMTLPFIGPFMEAAGMIIEKKILKLKNMNFKNYTVYEFLAIVVLMIPLMIILSFNIKPEALQPMNIIIMAFVIICALLANLLTFYSLKRETISEFEPIWVMQPLFTIVLAFILYQSERNWISIALALVASLSIIFAHIKKHHLVFDKYIIAAVAGSFLFAVELVASKPILAFYSPFSFYFVRCLFVLILCLIIFRPKGKTSINKKTFWMIVAVGITWVIYRAIIYYGYETLGIVYTTTLFILSPVLMILFAVIFLKEKPSLRQIISTIIIVACIVVSIILRN